MLHNSTCYPSVNPAINFHADLQRVFIVYSYAGHVTLTDDAYHSLWRKTPATFRVVPSCMNTGGASYDHGHAYQSPSTR